MLKKKKIFIFLGIFIVFFCIFFLFPKPNEIEVFYPNKSSEEFQNLIKNDTYQVFIFDCPAYFPFNFARHPWFVLNKKGEISRWEVRQEENKLTGSHLYLDAQPPFQGINVSFFPKKYFWKPELIGQIEGDENSSAKKVIDFIENSNSTYPYIYQYSLIGANSNTYLGWVLNNYPIFNKKLSWRFMGKDFILKY